MIGERFGRNARFAAVGTGLSAAVMGACGYFFTAQSVFSVTAALLIPALFVLRGIAPTEIDPETGSTPPPPANPPTSRAPTFAAFCASGRYRYSAAASCCSTSQTLPCFP